MLSWRLPFGMERQGGVVKKQIEEKLHIAISDEIFELAVDRAEKKLQSIILRFGDGNGVRRTPDYLEELVIEAIKSELLTEYTLLLIG